MTTRGVSDDDMPNFPWPGRRDASATEDASLAALLSGSQAPEDVAAGLQPAADVLAALRARPASDELAGEAMALAEFRDLIGVSPNRRTRRRRSSLLTSLLSAKVAVAAAAVAITIGGVATAAYAGALPGSAQRVAHDVIGAPAAHFTGGHAASRHHGDVTGHALCWAYTWAKAHGTAAQRAAIYKKLEKAAGGAGKITAYCAHARKPVHPFKWHGCWTAGPHPSWSPSPTPSGTPSPAPSWSPSAKHNLMCKPVAHPTVKPRHHRHHKFTQHKYQPKPRPTTQPTPMPSASA